MLSLNSGSDTTSVPLPANVGILCCILCHKVISESENVFKCAACAQSFHSACVFVNRIRYEEIQQFMCSNSFLVINCRLCLERSRLVRIPPVAVGSDSYSPALDHRNDPNEFVYAIGSCSASVDSINTDHPCVTTTTDINDEANDSFTETSACITTVPRLPVQNGSEASIFHGRKSVAQNSCEGRQMNNKNISFQPPPRFRKAQANEIQSKNELVKAGRNLMKRITSHKPKYADFDDDSLRVVNCNGYVIESNFRNLNLPTSIKARLLNGSQNFGYNNCLRQHTTMQNYVASAIINGRDLVVFENSDQAVTAASLVIVSELGIMSKTNSIGPGGLILVQNDKTATDIYGMIYDLIGCDSDEVKCSFICGGYECWDTQLMPLCNYQLMVATPGKLLRMMERKEVSFNGLKYLLMYGFSHSWLQRSGDQILTINENETMSQIIPVTNVCRLLYSGESCKLQAALNQGYDPNDVYKVLILAIYLNDTAAKSDCSTASEMYKKLARRGRKFICAKATLECCEVTYSESQIEQVVMRLDEAAINVAANANSMRPAAQRLPDTSPLMIEAESVVHDQEETPLWMILIIGAVALLYLAYFLK